MQVARWRIIKRNGKWIAYKRYATPGFVYMERHGMPRNRLSEYVTGMPYVVTRSNNSFETWEQAWDWVRHDRRRPLVMGYSGV